MRVSVCVCRARTCVCVCACVRVCAQAGRLLGVLNNNQMELESLGGSGLFPATAVVEHSCAPTCSFTTAGARLYLACVRPCPRCVSG
jgi:hypothetical protein